MFKKSEREKKVCVVPLQKFDILLLYKRITLYLKRNNTKYCVIYFVIMHHYVDKYFLYSDTIYKSYSVFTDAKITST